MSTADRKIDGPKNKIKKGTHKLSTCRAKESIKLNLRATAHLSLNDAGLRLRSSVR
jgi:hypothetical protein